MNENKIETGIGSGGDSLKNLFANLKKEPVVNPTPSLVTEPPPTNVWMPTAEEAAKIRKLVEGRNTGNANEATFYHEFRHAHIMVSNVSARDQDPNITPIFNHGNTEYTDFLLIEFGLNDNLLNDKYFAVVLPKFNRTYNQSTHLSGAGGAMFNFDNDPETIYGLDKDGNRSPWLLKEAYPEYTVLEPCIMRRDSQAHWTIVKKGLLHLGKTEPPADTVADETDKIAIDGVADAEQDFLAVNRAGTPPLTDGTSADLEQDKIYALRGGEEKTKEIVKQYQELASIKNADQLKWSNWFYKPKNQELWTKWEKLLFNELCAVYTFFGQSFETSGFEPDTATRNLMISFGKKDRLQISRNVTGWMEEAVAVALVRRNYALLKRDEKKVQFWEKKLDSFIKVYAEETNQQVKTLDYKKLYLFDDQPKSVEEEPVVYTRVSSEPKQTPSVVDTEASEASKQLTVQEKFLDAASEVTNSWSNEQKQTLAKLAHAALVFQEKYLEEESKQQEDLSEEERKSIENVVVIHTKRWTAEQYSDKRLALPKNDKKAIIALIPKLFSKSD